MRVYLIRHGQAEDAAVDAARPLSRQGREDVTRVAGFLSLFERPRPQWMAHSGKLRAQQTAGMFAEAWQIDDVHEVPDLQPGSNPAAWAARLEETDADVALVGHLPHMGRLAALLLSGRDAGREIVRLQAAAVVCLERGDSGWTILWHLHPGLFYSQD